MKDHVKKAVVDAVERMQGGKATELLSDRHWLSPETMVEVVTDYPLTELIEELVREGSIIEIEYVLSAIPYRVKSFLLPKNTLLSYPRPPEPDIHKLDKALDVFRLGEMTISKMRECISTWLLGADFSYENCTNDEDVFKEVDRVSKRKDSGGIA